MSDPWIAVAGTLLGVTLGYVYSFISERSRRRHEDAHRFDDERRAVYIRLIEASTEIEDRVRARHTAIGIRRDYPDLVEKAEAMRDERPDFAAMTDVPARPDYTKLELALAEIELLARFTVEMHATFVKFALQALDIANDQMAEGDHEKADKGWSAASASLHDARREFLRSAKADLDLPTGVMSKWEERRWRVKQRLGLAPRPKPKPDSEAQSEAQSGG